MSAAVFVVLVTLSISSGCWAGCQCPSDTWYSMEGVGCFKYFDVAKTFMDAEAACHDYSPTAGKIVHLASIHSAEEHNALIAMVPEAVNVWDPHVFIGLRLKDGVTPAWTDGSFYDYQNWCGADPNAHPAGDGCISGGFYCLGSWVDVPTGENRAYPFICKSPCF